MAAALVSRHSRRDLLAGLCSALLPRTLRAQTLFQQSIVYSLGMPAPGTEFLLFDVHAGQVLINTFAPQPIPVGSLLKPFLAMAYARSQQLFPHVICRGHADQCWCADGHGTLTLPEAIGKSCNAYFLTLARGLRFVDMPYLPAPPRDATPETLIGLTAAWPVAPLALARAYVALLTSPVTPALEVIREGMHLSATLGTAARVGQHRGGVLAKTGTAPCVDVPCRATGDGLILAAVPARQPTLLLLVRHRATTGAATAADAGKLLTRLESLHAF